jgi:hypothetical protein
MFYDVILRRRNWANAAFCCGAASVHRREAVMQAALRSYVWSVDAEIARHTRDIRDPATREALQDAMRPHVAFDTELTPYKFHVSEDIYTSILLHGDAARRWRSVMHPRIESKMLSPQDMLTWMIQRFKYAAGSLDILFHDNIFNRRRFKLSLPQTLMYATTFWSYLACVWNTVFLISPVIYLFTGIPPVSAWSTPFYLHFLPFFIVSELAFMFGTWGISAWDGRASYLSFFSMNLRALDTVLRGEQIKFHVTPKERQTGRFLYLVKPQIAIVLLTLTGLIWGGIQVARGQVDDPSGYVINIFWGAVNIAAMLPLIFAAMWTPPKSRRRADEDPRRPAIRAQLSHYPHWLPAGFCDCRVGGKTNARARREQRRDDVEPGFSAAPSPRELTFDEAIWARVAWQYYVNNTQPNGLANAHDGEPWLSLWSVGSYLFAVVAAEQLHIVTAAEGDERIAAALFTLGQLPLNAQGLPAAQYHADTLQILGNPDSSAIGMGRLLTALQTLLWRYPQHAAAVRDLFNQWRVGALISNSPASQAAAPLHHWALAADEPRDSFGYRLYASHTLRLIDSAAGLAVTNPPQGQQMIDIDGIMVPDEGCARPGVGSLR